MKELLKEFVPYEQALALKELGFNEPCFGYFNVTKYLGIGSFRFKECNKDTTDGYGNRILLRPTYSQAFKFFRENYNKTHFINKHITDGKFSSAIIHDMYKNGTLHPDLIREDDVEGTAIIFDTYEEAELACLKKLIELVKNDPSTNS